MRKLINIHLAIGGCITKEKIAVILMVITKGSWKGMIMAGSARAGEMIYQQQCG